LVKITPSQLKDLIVMRRTNTAPSPCGLSYWLGVHFMKKTGAVKSQFCKALVS
jgi:hypothetical protein